MVDKSDLDDEQDLYKFRLTLSILRYIVFPVVCYFAAAVNYFLIYTVFDLGLKRASGAYMVAIGASDYVSILGLIA